MKLHHSLLAAAAALAFCTAQAQTVIDQAKAVAGGITPGDAPGFPITLSLPGSYKLTSSLQAPAGVSAIVITASGVTLDLNSFDIRGTNPCTGWGTTIKCNIAAGPDQGIEAAPGVSDVRVHNGTVWQFGGTAIKLNERSMLSQLHVTMSGGQSAIVVGEDSLLTGVTAYRNLSTGIQAFLGGLIVDSQSDGNGKIGISVSLGTSGSLVANNRANKNGGGGMRSYGTFTNFVDNLADDPGFTGIAGGLSTAGNYCNGQAC